MLQQNDVLIFALEMRNVLLQEVQLYIVTWLLIRECGFIQIIDELRLALPLPIEIYHFVICNLVEERLQVIHRLPLNNIFPRLQEHLLHDIMRRSLIRYPVVDVPVQSVNVSIVDKAERLRITLTQPNQRYAFLKLILDAFHLISRYSCENITVIG